MMKRDLTHFVEHDDLKHYPHRICVNGTRGFDDYKFFSLGIWNYINPLLEMGHVQRHEIVFISGDATSGADKLIIDFAIEHGFKWTTFPAKWDDLDVEGAVIRTNRKTGRDYNVIAGHQRNEEMREVLTRLVSFYDGSSPGTRDMIQRVTEDNHPIWVIIIEKPDQQFHHEQKPQSSRESSTGTDRSHLAGWS